MVTKHVQITKQYGSNSGFFLKNAVLCHLQKMHNRNTLWETTYLPFKV